MTRLLEWLRAHEPVFCSVCSRLMFFKDAIQATQTGAVLPLCDKCYRELFNPFSEEE
jgi:hypothetical protein